MVAAPPINESSLPAALASIWGVVPDLKRAALVLLPEGFVLAATGEGTAGDHELLARAAVRCFGSGGGSLAARPGDEVVFTDYFAVMPEQVLLLLRCARQSRLALAVVCDAVINVGFMRVLARSALESLAEQVNTAEIDG